MIKKASILLFFLLGLLTAVTYGQESAQATMNVSVKVVQSNSIEVSENGKIILSRGGTSMLGSLTLKGIAQDNAVVNISNKISLEDSQQNRIELKVSSEVNKTGSAHNNITFMGTVGNEMKEGMYRGELSTTIEYF